MERLSIRANAKLNLFLDVYEKRPDSYHSVRTVMLACGISDFVTLEKRKSGIYLECIPDSSLPPMQNLAYRAALSFQKASGICAGINIRLEKKVPSEAGLGGGSADAAAVIRGMNLLYGSPLSFEQEISAARSLGADVPFFLCSGCMLMDGRGDLPVKELPLPSCALLMVKPASGIPTPAAYAELDRLNDGFASYRAKSVLKLEDALSDNDFSGTCSLLYNKFEEILPALNRDSLDILEYLRENAHAAILSGSGSACFGFFESEEQALECEAKIKNKFCNVICAVCGPRPSGLEIMEEA